MKAIVQMVAWSLLAGLILYLAINPQWGVLYQNPMAAIGFGLIGLGIFIEARKRAVQSAKYEVRNPK
ncbi:MAG: hypothetical protein WD042_18105 [Phycisphaeraceae bacterium]